jgi:hypothetical protein
MADQVLAAVKPLQDAFATAPVWIKVLAAIGGLLVTRVALAVVGSLYSFFRRPSKSLR